jgi:TetR/AcrR family transcriptional regulator, cholesterol catabolism regulator
LKLSDSPLLKETVLSGRERILDKAERLFRTSGYNGVSMRDIALDVGIKQASLYYHFPGKEQLFVAVTELVFERHRIGLQQAISNVQGLGLQYSQGEPLLQYSQGESLLRAQLHASARWFISQPPVHFLSMAHTDMPLLGEANSAKLSICYVNSIFEPLAQIFAQAQQRGEIRNTNSRLLAGFFLSVMESIPFVTNLSNTPQGEAEFIVNQMVDVLLDGLREH